MLAALIQMLTEISGLKQRYVTLTSNFVTHCACYEYSLTAIKLIGLGWVVHADRMKVMWCIVVVKRIGASVTSQ